MSVIRKEPFIEKVLSKMSESEKKDLLYILNNGGNNQRFSISSLPTNKGVYPVYFNFEDNTSIKTGILIYTDDHVLLGGEQCVLIAYHKYQDLAIYEVNLSNRTYKRINEYCDINELRRAVDDYIELEVIDIDDNNDVSFGKNVEIDGTLTVNTGAILRGNNKIALTTTSCSKVDDEYVSSSSFDSPVFIVFEIDTDSTHAGAQVSLLPYDTSECFTAFTLLIGGNYVNSYAYLDGDGHIHVAIPEDVTPTNFKLYSLKTPV